MRSETISPILNPLIKEERVMEESAVERLREHMFEVRDMRRPKPDVKVGTWAKVGSRNERFWCLVRRVCEDGSFVGVVDNHLVNSPWERGDEIVFQQSHVLEISEPGDALTFHSIAAALGSFSEAALAWRDVREVGGVAVPARPGSWFVLPEDKHVWFYK
jgi:hypothetical protein